MQNEKRHLFLNEKWERYPPIDQPTLTIAEFKKKFAKLSMGQWSPKTTQFFLAGRIVINDSNFILESGGEKINIEFSEPIEWIDILINGDQILATSSWGNVVVQAEGFESRPVKLVLNNVKLLAPALTPPQKLNMSIKRGRQWHHFLNLIRKTFAVLEFTEVRTPSLVRSPGTEPYLDHFRSQMKNETLYLPTSPELHLKKMMSRGWDKIFEIKSCFRNNEISQHHQPEFSMLEWYRSYSNLEQIEKDVKGIFNFLKLHWPDPVTGFGFLTTTTVSDLFLKYCNFQLTPSTSLSEIRALALDLKVPFNESDSFDDLFFRIFLEKIESQLGLAGPQIVKYYPPSQSALARLTPDGWAARFEVYWKGLEIANAFDELNDPTEQRRRCEADNQLRAKLGRPPVPIDPEFIDALDCGFPPSAGIALGLDRLFMGLVNESQIHLTREFYFLNANVDSRLP